MKEIVWLTLSIIFLFTACTSPKQDEARKGLLSGEHAITRELQQSLSPREIIEEFKKGNRRFMAGETIGFNYQRQAQETASAQYPPAVVLSCIDSRVSPEIVFDMGLGDVFDVRVAGNIVDEDVAGSLEYACKVAGSKVVLVMGHNGCGAVKGAIDGVKLGNLTGLLAKIAPAVEASSDVEGERTSKNKKLVKAAAMKNVELTIETIRKMSPVLRQLEQEKKIIITGCFYDVETGEAVFQE